MKFVGCFILLLFFSKTHAQVSEVYTSTLTYSLAALNTSFDGRSAALGGTSVGTMSDASAPYLNLAKLPFHSRKYGTSISYSPLLVDLIGFSIPGLVLQGFFNFGKTNQNSLAGGLQFISFGEIDQTDATGNILGNYNPSQLSGFLGYSRRFGKFAAGASFQIVHQSLVPSPITNINTVSSQATTTFSGNLGMYFSTADREKLMEESVSELIFNAGLSFKNIGPKVQYLNISTFQPANLALGLSIVHAAGENFIFQHSLELKKLLIPLYPLNTTNNEDLKRYFAQDLFTSYGKAITELETLSVHLGVEGYIVKPRLFVRVGGMYGKYLFGDGGLTLTAGLGYKYYDYGIHLSYNYTNWSISKSSFFLTIFWDLGGYLREENIDAFDLDGFSVEELFPELE